MLFCKQIVIILWPTVVFSLVQFITCPPTLENGETSVKRGEKPLAKVTNPAFVQRSAAVQPKTGSPKQFDVETKGLSRSPKQFDVETKGLSRSPKQFDVETKGLSRSPLAASQKILPAAPSESGTDSSPETTKSKLSPETKLKPPAQDVPKTRLLKSERSAIAALQSRKKPDDAAVSPRPPNRANTVAAPSSPAERPKSVESPSQPSPTPARSSPKYTSGAPAAAAVARRPDESPTKTAPPTKPGRYPSEARAAASTAETFPVRSSPSETPTTSVKQRLKSKPEKPTDAVTKNTLPPSTSTAVLMMPRSLGRPADSSVSTTIASKRAPPSGTMYGEVSSPPGTQRVTATRKSTLVTPGETPIPPQQNVKKMSKHSDRDVPETPEVEEYYSNGYSGRLQKQNSRISRIVGRPVDLFFRKPAKTAWRFANFLRNKVTRNNGGNP